MATARRPNTIRGQLLRLAGLRPSLVAAAAAILAAPLLLLATGPDGDARLATFNIENYPRSTQQEDGAFELLRGLDPGVVAVQEITDPDRFQVAAQRNLGERWRTTWDAGEQLQHLGVLYDADRYELAASRTHFATVIYEGAKPTLEARLVPTGGGRGLRIFVVHLKAGGGHAATRRRQLDNLRPIVERAVRAEPERVVVLGDFNATGPDDRSTVASFAGATGLRWASSELACTMFWERSDGCRAEPLDHVLVEDGARDVTARGPCETIGCAPRDRCPAFHREVSDHCPVTIDL